VGIAVYRDHLQLALSRLRIAHLFIYVLMWPWHNSDNLYAAPHPTIVDLAR
jgi:hypothetical protein